MRCLVLLRIQFDTTRNLFRKKKTRNRSLPCLRFALTGAPPHPQKAKHSALRRRRFRSSPRALRTGEPRGHRRRFAHARRGGPAASIWRRRRREEGGRPGGRRARWGCCGLPRATSTSGRWTSTPTSATSRSLSPAPRPPAPPSASAPSSSSPATAARTTSSSRTPLRTRTSSPPASCLGLSPQWITWNSFYRVLFWGLWYLHFGRISFVVKKLKTLIYLLSVLSRKIVSVR